MRGTPYLHQMSWMIFSKVFGLLEMIQFLCFFNNHAHTNGMIPILAAFTLHHEIIQVMRHIASFNVNDQPYNGFLGMSNGENHMTIRRLMRSYPTSKKSRDLLLNFYNRNSIPSRPWRSLWLCLCQSSSGVRDEIPLFSHILFFCFTPFSFFFLFFFVDPHFPLSSFSFLYFWERRTSKSAPWFLLLSSPGFPFLCVFGCGKGEPWWFSPLSIFSFCFFPPVVSFYKRR